VAFGESSDLNGDIRKGCNIEAFNDVSQDVGLWQINRIHWGNLTREMLCDPIRNATLAKSIFRDAGNNWNPWNSSRSSWDEFLRQGLPDRVLGEWAPKYAKHSGFAVDVSGAAVNPGAPIVQWTPRGADNQIFRMEHIGPNNIYRIRCKHSGHAVHVAGVATDCGARAEQRLVSTSLAQQFKVVVGRDGYAELIAQHSKFCLDVFNASRDPGAALIQWPRTVNADEQRFKL
jgi:Ricin-type beta-trefoil lectin domain-like/Lysozyme like domain